MRPKTLFECAGCGHQEPKWLGRCPSCGKWNSFTEVASAALPARSAAGDGKGTAIPLSSIETRERMRLDTGISEMNRVLGGGLMKGSSVLMGGDPGIGKSTLMLQLAARLSVPGRILYVSGEESPG
ncbi:MAG TPA: ATPase domain-containing protein, partial [Spirochaetia bacterium]|nr:ATPase domain-containing protein [Spirochaetia bacterium]